MTLDKGDKRELLVDLAASDLHRLATPPCTAAVRRPFTGTSNWPRGCRRSPARNAANPLPPTIPDGFEHYVKTAALPKRLIAEFHLRIESRQELN
jgi:hypothetical protein